MAIGRVREHTTAQPAIIAIMLLRPYTQGEVSSAGYLFWCPGCQEPHALAVAIPNDRGARWNFDGNVDRPTFTPSVLVSDDQGTRCHLFITNGRIEYLGDCRHAMAGQTVDMEDWEW